MAMKKILFVILLWLFVFAGRGVKGVEPMIMEAMSFTMDANAPVPVALSHWAYQDRTETAMDGHKIRRHVVRLQYLRQYRDTLYRHTPTATITITPAKTCTVTVTPTATITVTATVTK